MQSYSGDISPSLKVSADLQTDNSTDIHSRWRLIRSYSEDTPPANVSVKHWLQLLRELYLGQHSDQSHNRNGREQLDGLIRSISVSQCVSLYRTTEGAVAAAAGGGLGVVAKGTMRRVWRSVGVESRKESETWSSSSSEQPAHRWPNVNAL